MSSKVIEIVTNKVIEQLEKGSVPWKKGWKSFGSPRNAVSGKNYRGFNSFLLSLYGFSDPRFVTYKQAQDLKGFVKTGEKGIPVIFWNFQEEEMEDGKKDKRAFMRYYTVFNVTQCEELKIPTLEEITKAGEAETVMTAESILEGYYGKPRIVEGGDRAFYSVDMDYVQMPTKKQFNTTEAYYGTLFHELVHSTGHKDRLNRFKDALGASQFGSESYSKEELVAELGATILCDKGGVEKDLTNSASYIAGWLRALKNDRGMIIKAVSQAEKASNFILGIKEEAKEE